MRKESFCPQPSPRAPGEHGALPGQPLTHGSNRRGTRERRDGRRKSCAGARAARGGQELTQPKAKQAHTRHGESPQELTQRGKKSPILPP